MTRGVPSDQLRQNNWRPVRRLCLLAYAFGVAALVAADGVPTNRIVLMTIVVAGLSIGSIGYGWRRFSRVLIDWLPFTLVLLVYDLSRSLSDRAGLPLHEQDVLGAERLLFAGHIPTLWLQHHLYSPGQVHWYDALATLVYTSHFLATPILAAILWMRNREAWVAFISRVIVLSFAGLITYVLFPEAPPWLAAQDGLVSPVHRLSAEGWVWLHWPHLESLVDAAQNQGSNLVAAMPSLHTAFATLIAVFIATRLTSRWRYLLYLYPAAMGFTLVYTGEHYVLDVVAGVGYALLAHAAVGRWQRSRRDLVDFEMPESVRLTAEASA